jgi:hypothetical protein
LSGSRPVMRPVKASVFSRRQTCRGKVRSPVVRSSGVAGNHSQTKGRADRKHKLQPKPARQSSTLPMSGMWKRSHGRTNEAPLEAETAMSNRVTFRLVWGDCCQADLLLLRNRARPPAVCAWRAGLQKRSSDSRRRSPQLAALAPVSPTLEGARRELCPLPAQSA